jgi:hypothetical protein
MLIPRPLRVWLEYLICRHWVRLWRRRRARWVRERWPLLMCLTILLQFYRLQRIEGVWWWWRIYTTSAQRMGINYARRKLRLSRSSVLSLSPDAAENDAKHNNPGGYTAGNFCEVKCCLVGYPRSPLIFVSLIARRWRRRTYKLLRLGDQMRFPVLALRTWQIPERHLQAPWLL